MHCIFLSFLFLSFLIFSGCQSASSLSFDFEKKDYFEKSLLEKINAWRRAKGKKIFLLHLPLQNLANVYSKDMAERHYFSHIDMEGRNPKDRILAAGIFAKDVGENLAKIKAGRWFIEDLLKAWLNSKSHRENLEEDCFEKTGIGIYKDALGNYYITQIFISS